MSRRVLWCVWLAVFGVVDPVGAQDKSVRPGINDSFRDPDPQQFTERFEIESREVFAKREAILKAMSLKPTDVVADIGAGTGLFTRLFASNLGPEGRVIAVDIAQKFLDHIEVTCRERNLRNVETLLCRDDSTELPPNSVDVAFICDTYHHFEFPNRTMVSLRKAMKPGGRVIVVDFKRIEGESTEWTLSHVRAGQEVFEREIIGAGFKKLEELRDVLTENYFLVFKVDESAQAATGGILQYPVIEGFGGVTEVAGAVEAPRAGARLVMDITVRAQSAAEVSKGLDRAARVLNLYGVCGLRSEDIRITVVLHGEATEAVLTDASWQQRYQVAANPNLPLISLLQRAGVEVLVCGQALGYRGIDRSEVVPQVPVAMAAFSVLMNRQADGYSYLPVH